jgi:hypothetical protein
VKIGFRFAKHTVRPAEVIEVWDESQPPRFLAAIYATDLGIRITSKHYSRQRIEALEPWTAQIALEKP